MNNTWVVEYYSDDEDMWLECSNDFFSLSDAIKCMRMHADSDPCMAHRIVHTETKRKTIAISAYGEELVK